MSPREMEGVTKVIGCNMGKDFRDFLIREVEVLSKA
jgi:hypothetical protein